MSGQATIRPGFFAAFHASTKTLAGSQRLELFYSLPPRLQQDAWRELRYEIEHARGSDA